MQPQQTSLRAKQKRQIDGVDQGTGKGSKIALSNELSAAESVVIPSRRSFSRAVITSLLGNTAVQALFALSSIVVSRVLLPEGRGELATLITYSEVLSYVTIFGIQQATSHAIARRPELTGQITKEACVLTFVLSGLASLLGAVFGPYLLPADKQFLGPLMHWFMIYVLLYNLNWVLNSASQGGFKFGWYNICRVLVPASYLLGVVGVWFFDMADVYTVSWCRLISLILVIGVQIYGLRFVLRDQWPRLEDYWRLLRHGLKLHPPHVADSIQVCLDPLLVVFLLPTEAMGLYAAAISVARIQLGMGMAYTDALFVKVSEQTDHESAVRVLLNLIRRAQFYLILTAAGVMLATPWVIDILFGRAFAGAIPAAIVLEMATGVAGAGNGHRSRHAIAWSCVDMHARLPSRNFRRCDRGMPLGKDRRHCGDGRDQALGRGPGIVRAGILPVLFGENPASPVLGPSSRDHRGRICDAQSALHPNG